MIKAACFLLSKGGRVIHQGKPGNSPRSKPEGSKCNENVIKIKLLVTVLLSNTGLFSASRHIFVGLCHNLADRSMS